MAGLQIVIPGADFSGSGIPRNIRTIEGTTVPAYDAVGLWTFDEGTPGQPYSGKFLNRVTGDSAASVRPGWTAPVMQNFGTDAGGFSVTDINGTLIDTGVSAQRSAFTMAQVVRIRPRRIADLANYNLIHMLTGDAMNSIPATNTSGSLQTISGLWGVGATLNNSRSGWVLRAGATISASSNNQFHSDLGMWDEWIAIGIAIDGQAGSALVQTLSGATLVTDAARGNTLIQTAYGTNLSQRNGNFLFGIAPNGSPRDTPGTLGDVMCAAVYDAAKSQREVADILAGLARIATDRGVTVRGA